MATVNVQTTVIPNYQAGGSTATIRIYATEDFFNGGTQYVGGLGYFYQEIPCTVSGTNVTVPAFNLASTTDSNIDTAKYIAFLYSSLGTKVTMLMGGMEFAVPPTNLSTTWQDIALFNEAPIRRMDDSYYTSHQVDMLLETLDFGQEVTDLQADVVQLQADVSNKQPLDADLTAIAALDPANSDFLQRKSGVWTHRTPAQVKTDLDLPVSTTTELAGKASTVHTHATGDITGLAEVIEDTIGTKVVAGTNISVSYNDTTGETTVAATGGVSDWGDIGGTLSDQTDLQAALDAKQDDLVSSTNIKTVNGNSLLGSGNLLISPSRGSLYFDQDTPQAINCGQFYHPDETYDDFFTEAWVKFTKANTDGYAVIDGYGGLHYNILGAVSDATKARLTGKYYEGSSDYGNTSEKFFLDEWTHIAHGWDGSHYMQWINGCLTFIVSETTARYISPSASAGVLFIGGPGDHSMWEGYIAQVRIYEGSNSFTAALDNGATDFFPERYFRPIRYKSGTYYMPQGMWDLTTPACTYPDQSEGFDPVVPAAGTKYLHAGTLSSTAQAVAGGIPYYSENLPLFVTGDITRPTSADTPPSTPVGAIVFDSFSRRDTTYAFEKSGNSVAGSTEAGTAGPLAWSVQGWPIRDGRMAYWYNYSAINTVDCGVADVDVRVSRVNNSFCHTGLILRYTDASNYLYVKAYPDQLVTGKVVAGVDTILDNDTGLSTNWTTLRAVVNGTNLDVYRDATLVQSALVVPSSSATKHGLHAPSTGTKIVTRFDDFTILAA